MRNIFEGKYKLNILVVSRYYISAAGATLSSGFGIIFKDNIKTGFEPITSSAESVFPTACDGGAFNIWRNGNNMPSFLRLFYTEFIYIHQCGARIER